MEQGFDLLEEKVRKAADLVKRLRKENKGLEEDLAKAKGRLQDSEKRLSALEKERAQAKGGPEVDELQAEVKSLRQQKDEVRKRIERIVEVLESLDEGGEAP
jgi:predicted  nucleic acid-binding Zn-ribbon protein